MDRTAEQVFGMMFDRYTWRGQAELRKIWRVAKKVAEVLPSEDFAVLRSAIEGAYTFAVMEALAAAKDA